MKERIKYIDALRGFTMLLVVFAHIELLGFGISPYSSTLGGIFVSFRMPMFFFISGYIAYKAITWDFGTYIKSVRKKAIVQLIPTIFFFSLFTFSHMPEAGEEVLQNGWGGYWFTVVLFEFFLIYYTICYFTKQSDIWLILVSILGIVSLVLFRNDSVWWNMLCMENVCKYFQFFAFGVLAKKHNGRFMGIIRNDIVRACFIIGFIVCIMLVSCTSVCDTFWGKSLIRDILIRYTGLIVVFSFFMSKEELFKSEGKFKWISQSMQYVGRHTLDIYLLHYFFLPTLPVLAGVVRGGAVIELSVTLIISIIIIMITLLVSEVIRSSDFLAHYLFGAKSEKYKI